MNFVFIVVELYYILKIIGDFLEQEQRKRNNIVMVYVWWFGNKEKVTLYLHHMLNLNVVIRMYSLYDAISAHIKVDPWKEHSRTLSGQTHDRWYKSMFNNLCFFCCWNLSSYHKKNGNHSHSPVCLSVCVCVCVCERVVNWCKTQSRLLQNAQIFCNI